MNVTRFRKLLRPALQTLAGAGLLALWVHSVNFGEVWTHARPHHLWLVAAILAAGLVASVLRALRWALLLARMGRVTILDALWLNAAGGLINYAVPLRTGDAARVWWANRRHRVPAGSGLATVLVDKTFDLAAVVLVLGSATAYAWSQHRLSASVLVGLSVTTAIAACLLLAVLALAWAGPRLARSKLSVRWLPSRWSGEATEQSFSFRAGARAASSPARALVLTLLSLAALSADAFAFSLLFRALDIAVPFGSALAAYAALVLVFTVPAAPGYVGSLEVAGSLVIGTGLGVGAAAAAGAVVLWHAMNALLVLMLGVIGLTRVSRPLRKRSERPARVAVLHCGFTYSGGGERIVIEEVLGLRRRGFQVECFAPTVDAHACYPDLIGEVGVRTLVPQLPQHLPLRDAIHMLAASALVPIYAWRFRDFDVLVGCNQPGAWIAWWLSKLLDTPYVVYLNQPNRLVYPRAIDLATGWQTKRDYELLNRLIQRVRGFVAWADRRSIREAGELLVNGDYIGDIIRATYERPAADCPAGCHVGESRLPARERFRGAFLLNDVLVRKPYVLLTNRHYPQKRFDLAIRAMRLVCDRFPKAQLVIPGAATNHTPQLLELAAELGLEANVLFPGVITESELQRLYAEAAVYVYPAPEEDFGMGVIEAMAAGVPVVAWNHAGPTVTVADGETGHLARPGDVEDYAAGILNYLGDRAFNEETARRAHRRARLFSWERHVDKLVIAIEAAGGAIAEPERAAELEVMQAG
jgi:uncharacterized protein (TIRG00374 family)